jgi:hypothetical protein
MGLHGQSVSKQSRTTFLVKCTRTYLPTRWVPLSDLSRPEWEGTLAAAVEAQGQEVAATAEPGGGALFAAE